MTIQDKNIAIAEMLGWIELIWDEPSRERVWNPDMHHEHAYVRLDELAFNSDANWQSEAIDWIENNSSYSWFWTVNSTGFEQSGYESFTIIDVSTVKIPKKEAIFEALYQFSQYLKQK